MNRTLKIEILSYWHPGTGRGQGSHLDAVTHRSGNGLPCLPGRTVKGLLRDAAHRWESFGGFGSVELPRPSITDQLFGPYGAEGVETWPGLLRCSDATLPDSDVDYLFDKPKLVDGFYRSHFATKIEHDTGTAEKQSLRGIELVVPLTLYAQIDQVPNARHSGLTTAWPEKLNEALPLVRAVGANRSRGLGRAVLTLEGAQ